MHRAGAGQHRDREQWNRLVLVEVVVVDEGRREGGAGGERDEEAQRRSP
jgi:hypothetical protein